MKQRSKWDEFFWNTTFSLVFLLVVFFGYISYANNGINIVERVKYIDLIIIFLATWRLIRLIVYDKITKIYRSYFDNEKVISGPRKTMAELIGCPWCISVWISAIVFYLYFLHSFFVVFFLILAISIVASFMQLFTNLVGWNAEKKKIEVKKIEEKK